MALAPRRECTEACAPPHPPEQGVVRDSHATYAALSPDPPNPQEPALSNALSKPVATLALLCCTLTAHASGLLYGVDSNRSLYTIDFSTGAKTLVGALGAEVGIPAGMAYDPVSGKVYVSSSNNDALFTLNLSNATATLVGSFGTDVVMHGLEWDSSSGTLYGASSTPNSFYRISTATGAASVVGGIGLSSFNNLGYDSTANVMYMTNSSTDALYTLNRATGAATLVGALQGPTNPNGLAYAAELQTMFLIDNNTDTLYSLNLGTGAASAIGSMGAGNLLGLVYVAAAVVPEPGTYALFGLGLAGLAAWRRLPRSGRIGA
jgi:PEP-CTERM motif